MRKGGAAFFRGPALKPPQKKYTAIFFEAPACNGAPPADKRKAASGGLHCGRIGQGQRRALRAFFRKMRAYRPEMQEGGFPALD